MEIAFYIVCGIALALGVWVVILILSNSKQKQLTENGEKEYRKLQLRLQKTEQSYKEMNQAKDNLQTMHEELKERYEKVNRMAYTDPLTELPNRQQFHEILEGIMLTLRAEESVGLTVLEFSGLYTAAEAAGSSVGTEVLIDVAQRLRANLAYDDDYLARISETRFAVITQNFESFREFDEKLKRLFKLLAVPFTVGGREYQAKVYGGCALAPKDGKSQQLLVMNADMALEEAKKQTGSAYCYYEDAMAKRVMDRMEQQAELKKMMESDGLSFRYLARVDLRKNRVACFEVVPVWEHATRGRLLPADYMELLEEGGYAKELLRRQMTVACDGLRVWEERGYPDIEFAIPCSKRQFADEEFSKIVYDVLQTTGTKPSRVLLELPADVWEQDRAAVEVIKKMERFGVRFVLNRFGKESTSMMTLRKAAGMQVTLDEALTKEASPEEVEQIMTAVVGFAHAFSLSVIADTIDCREQEVIAKKARCEFAQGELYGGYMQEEIAMQFLRIYGKESKGKS